MTTKTNSDWACDCKVGECKAENLTLAPEILCRYGIGKPLEQLKQRGGVGCDMSPGDPLAAWAHREIMRLTKIVTQFVNINTVRIDYTCPECQQPVVFGESTCPVTRERHKPLFPALDFDDWRKKQLCDGEYDVEQQRKGWNAAVISGTTGWRVLHEQVAIWSNENGKSRESNITELNKILAANNPFVAAGSGREIRSPHCAPPTGARETDTPAGAEAITAAGPVEFVIACGSTWYGRNGKFVADADKARTFPTYGEAEDLARGMRCLWSVRERPAVRHSTPNHRPIGLACPRCTRAHPECGRPLPEACYYYSAECTADVLGPTLADMGKRHGRVAQVISDGIELTQLDARRAHDDRGKLLEMQLNKGKMEPDDGFKNFHRQLCERFGYAHDEKDWQRDLVSLIEWIAERQVDGWRAKAAAWLESTAVEQEAKNARWPMHAAAYLSWRQRPEILRMLACDVMQAAQETPK